MFYYICFVLVLIGNSCCGSYFFRVELALVCFILQELEPPPEADQANAVSSSLI